MNGNYYQNPTFPAVGNSIPGQNVNLQQMVNPVPEFSGTPLDDNEMSYIENILRINKGKQIKTFASFPDSQNWKDKEFTGIIEEAGRDHLILSNPQNGDWYLIPMIYVNYFEFKEKIDYSHSYSEKTF